jgi:hypothetical protein
MTKICQVIIVAVTCLSCSARAQQIVYDLPQPVVNKIFQQISASPDTAKLAILLTSLEQGKYKVSILDRLSAHKDINETLVKRTNRFVKVNEILIPLITHEDIAFADFGTVLTPESKNEKRRVGKKKIIFTDDSKGITFDRSGKIY